MNESVHSRYALGTAAISAVALSLLYYLAGTPIYPGGDGGIVSEWSSWRIDSAAGNLAAGLSVNLAIVTIITLVTRRHNVLRCVTKLPGTMYIAMMLATPSLLLFLYPGLLLCLVVVTALWLMYASYDNKYSTRSVFMTFFLLSGMSAIDYAFIAYIPVFILGLAQMRIFKMRSILAMLMGMATPWIILLCMGIVPVDGLQWPQALTPSSPGMGARFSVMLAVGIFTAFLGLSSWLQGLIKMLSYNAKSRAMLSLLFVTMLVTIIAGSIDHNHLAVYLPLLNCCAALEAGHMFGTVYRHGKSYIAVLAIIGVYLSLYVWRIISHVL